VLPVAPASGDHLPAGQLTQLENEERNTFPAVHFTQALIVELPASDSNPSGQSTHTPELLYFEAWHCVQGPPSGPVEPAGQFVGKSSHWPLFVALGFVPFGHGPHAVLPLPGAKVPAEQAWHMLPKNGLNFPGMHDVHDVNGPSKPGLHEQNPSNAYAVREFGGHTEQFSGPDLYVHASHFLHGPPPGPTYPSVHAQLERSVMLPILSYSAF